MRVLSANMGRLSVTSGQLWTQRLIAERDQPVGIAIRRPASRAAILT
jgi:hypothetical protein